MSIDAISLPEGQRTVDKGLPALGFCMAGLSLVSLVALLGGRPMATVVLGALLAFVVWARPREAAGIAMLFLFGAAIFAPPSNRFDYTLPAVELYYWSAGLFLITIAGVARLGLKHVLGVPVSARAFLAVSIMAALYAAHMGVSTRNIVGQLYGILLLIVYFGIALNSGDQELLLRRIQTFGVPLAVCFLVYYVAVFPTYGFHKETTPARQQASLLAVVLCISGVERKKLPWVLGGLMLLVVPALTFARGDMITFLLSVVAALGIALKSKTVRILSCISFLLIAVVAIFPPVTQVIADELLGAPVIGQIVPQGSQDAATLLDREVQMAAALETAQVHPFLGTGLGSEIVWDSPLRGTDQSVVFVDSCWAFLLQKTGLLGLVAFIWFLITIFRSISRASLAFSALLLSLALVTSFNEPVFFHYTTAPFVGTFAGFLLAKKYRGRSGPARQSARDWRATTLPQVEGA